MINNRQSFRLRRQLKIGWSVPEQNLKGQGAVFNISLEGMLFVTDKLFQPSHEMAMAFKCPEIPAFPANGKLVWFKKIDGGQYQCGIKFLKDHQRGLWRIWMEDNILKLGEAQDTRILQHYLDGGPGGG